jgi:predicted glycoside hydrolase/deacetylase ChbG (UPF0249 family)
MGKRLIINADDLGYDPEVSRGILKAMREGLVSSTTMMVNTPHSASAAKEAQGLAVGLHLNLARYSPLSPAFASSVLVNGELAEARASELPKSAVHLEVLAQLDRLEALLSRPATHIDVHKHLHQHPNVLDGLTQAAVERGLPVRAIDEAMRQRLRSAKVKTTDHFIGGAGKAPYWTLEQLAGEISALQEGTTELMCHPGFRPSTLKSGYAEQREVELATFTAAAARELLDRAGVEVVSFRALA